VPALAAKLRGLTFFLAVLAAVFAPLAAFRDGAVAGGMRAFIGVSHRDLPLEIPAVWSGPTVLEDLLFELALTLHEIRRVGEALETLGPVGLDNTELVTAFNRWPRFVSQVFAFAFEPPEHDS
jgi:hypothetical protein